MKKASSKLTSFKDYLDKQYGVLGTDVRKKYEQEFDAFKTYVISKVHYKKYIDTDYFKRAHTLKYRV